MPFQPPVRPPGIQQFSGMAFSQDGRLGALVSGDRIVLLDTANWQATTLAIQPGATALAFSHEGTDLAVARSNCRYLSPIGVPQDRFVEIFIIKVATGAISTILTEPRVDAVHDLAYTADGTLVAVASRADPDRPRQPGILGPNRSVSVDDLFLWNIFAERLTSVLPERKSRALQGFYFTFSPSGSVVAFSLLLSDKDRVNHGEVRIYDAAAGALMRTIQKGYPESARPLAFSSDGRLLVYDFSPWSGNFLTRIYDIVQRKFVRSIKNLPIPIGWLAFSDSGKVVVSTGFRNYPAFVNAPAIWHESGSGTGRIYILDDSGVPERRIEADRAYLAGKLVPKQDLLASFNGNVLTLYDLRTGAVKSAHTIGSAGTASAPPDRIPNQPAPEGPPRGRMVSAHRILALSFLPGSRALACAGDDGVLRLWDPVKGDEIERTAVARSYPIALSESGATAQPGDGASVVVSEMAGGATSYQLKGLAGQPASLAFSAGGDWLAAGAEDGSICVWRKGHSEPQFVLTGHTGPVNSVAFSRDISVLASGGNDKTVRLWDLSSGLPLQVFKGHSKRVIGVAFGADRNSLASCGEDSAIIIWDVARRRTSKKFWDPNGPVRSLCFSPDGMELISGGTQSLRRWDVKKRKLIGVLVSGRGDLRSGTWSRATYGFLETFMVMSYSPDGSLLACGCTNNSLLVWDTKSWEGRILSPSGM